METEIMKKVKELCRFLPDEYSIIQHIEEDPHGDLGLLKSLPLKKKREYISIVMNSTKN